MTFSFQPEDGVFTDNSTPASQNFGFRFNKAFKRQKPLAWMMDGELFLGVIDGELLDVPLPETIFGLHAFVGPQYTAGHLTFCAAGGLNRTSVPATELVSKSRAPVMKYVGRGGLSRLWAATLNSLTSSGQSTVQASIPAYAKVAPAGMFGLAYDIGSSGPGFRLSADFLPVFADKTRNNFRSTLSITF